MEEQSVDTVVTTWTLCTIPDVTAALREMRHAPKSSGEVLFVETGDRRIQVRRWQDGLAGVEVSRRRLSSGPADSRASQRLRISHRTTRHGIYDEPEADDLHVRRQRASDVTAAARLSSTASRP